MNRATDLHYLTKGSFIKESGFDPLTGMKQKGNNLLLSCCRPDTAIWTMKCTESKDFSRNQYITYSLTVRFQFLFDSNDL